LHFASTNILITFKTQVIFKIIFMKEVKKRSDCPISCTLDVFGDKWSFLIIRDLLLAKECTYGDFLKSAEGIATNILAARLVMLEENKIIEKLEHPKSKAKVLYKLTRKGIDLLPVLIEMHLWFEKYASIPEGTREMLELVKKDKAGFIENYTKMLES
jgi:DNA-binding HxlR family transcriptional regulator